MSKTQLVATSAFEQKTKQHHYHKPIKNLSLAALSCAMQAGIPVVLIGDPGTGKTETIRALAKAMGRYCETITASNREPSDFGGIPMKSVYTLSNGLDIECFRLIPPEWAVTLLDKPGSVLFIDELNTVPKAVEVVLMRILLEKVVGNLTLPSSTIIVGAINPPEIATNGSEFSAPTANRLCHIDWSLNPSEWCNGMANGWQIQLPPELPKHWESDYLPQAIGLITGFIHKSEHQLLQLPKEESNRNKPWPSPRSWDFATRLMAASRSLYGEFSDVEHILVAGVIGTSAAHELFAYLRNLDLPDPKVILDNPEKWQINMKRTDIIFSVISTVNTYYSFNKSMDLWFKAVNLYGQLFKPEIGLSDLATIGMKFLYQNKPKDFDSFSHEEKQKRIGWLHPYMGPFLELSQY